MYYTLLIEHTIIILYITTIVKMLSINYNIKRIFIKRCADMISYEPFYRTIKEKNISTYRLINEFSVSRSLIDRLKHNKPISTVTLNDLCTFLDCRVEDVILYIPDEKQ